MAFETSAERAKAIADADKASLNFVTRTRTVVHEAGVYLNDMAATKANLEAAKTASDAVLAADETNVALVAENALLAGKIAEQTVLIQQGTALKAALEELV